MIHGFRRLFLLFTIHYSLLTALQGQTPALTTVKDTVYKTDGTLGLFVVEDVALAQELGQNMGSLSVSQAGGRGWFFRPSGSIGQDRDDCGISRVDGASAEAAPGMFIHQESLPLGIISSEMSNGRDGKLEAERKAGESHGQAVRGIGIRGDPQGRNLPAKLRVYEGIRCRVTSRNVNLFIYRTTAKKQPAPSRKVDCGPILFFSCWELVALADNMAGSGKVTLPVYEKAGAHGALYLELIGVVEIAADYGDDAPLNGFYCFDRKGMRRCAPGEEKERQEEAGDSGTVIYQEIPRIVPPIRCGPFYHADTQ